LLLSELEDKFETGHVIALLHVEEDEQCLVLDEAIGRSKQFVLQFAHRLLCYFCCLSLFLKQVNVGYSAGTLNMRTFVKDRLSQELLHVLDILLINNLCEDSECIGLKNIIIIILDVFCETADDNEYLVLTNIEFFNEDVNQPSQILVVFVSLRLRNLEEFSDVEEDLTFFILSEFHTLV
jgi:hypothetical protein